MLLRLKVPGRRSERTAPADIRVIMAEPASRELCRMTGSALTAPVTSAKMGVRRGAA